MLGKRKRLKELEAAVARLEHQGKVSSPTDTILSPAARDAVIVAADQTLTAILVPVRAAIVAGQTNKAVLLEAVRMPLIRVLAMVPEPQMAEAHLVVWSTFISELIDKMLELDQARVNGQGAHLC